MSRRSRYVLVSRSFWSLVFLLTSCFSSITFICHYTDSKEEARFALCESYTTLDDAFHSIA